jgi:hypothetical protein
MPVRKDFDPVEPALTPPRLRPQFFCPFFILHASFHLAVKVASFSLSHFRQSLVHPTTTRYSPLFDLGSFGNFPHFGQLLLPSNWFDPV